MAVTDRDLAALIYLAGRLREDTYGAGPWDAHGTEVVFVRELKGKNLQIALEEILAHACDPDAKTPAAITRPFKPDPVARAPRRGLAPRKSEECTLHPGQFADNCGGCKADALADDSDDVEPLKGACGPEDVRAAMGLPPKVPSS